MTSLGADSDVFMRFCLKSVIFFEPSNLHKNYIIDEILVETTYKTKNVKSVFFLMFWAEHTVPFINWAVELNYIWEIKWFKKSKYK